MPGSRHRFLYEPVELLRVLIDPRIMSEGFRIFVRRAFRFLLIEGSGTARAGGSRRQSVVPLVQAHMRVPAVEAKVRHDDLAFVVRHQQKPEDERIEFAQLRPVQPGEDGRARIE